MAKSLLPLSVSSKTADITADGEALELNPFANAGITAADAPVLLALGSKGTVGADALAGRMVKHGGHGTKAEARLFLNTFAAVMGDLVDEYGAITVQTPFGTVQTFIAGTIANPQDQPDPSVNYAFLGVVIPEAYRRLFAQIETYVPAEACPAALKRVRDKATNAGGIRGTDPFYLEGREMTHGGDGETLELLDAVTRDKLCDIAVDAESKSPVQFLCTLSPQTALAAGPCLVRLMTLAGGEGTLWPLELKTELLEAVPAPIPPVPQVSDLKLSGVAFEDGMQFYAGAATTVVTGTNYAYAEGDRGVVSKTVGGETKSVDFDLHAHGEDGAFPDLTGELGEAGFDDGDDVTLRFILHGGVAGSPDQVIERTVRLQMGA